MRRALIKSDGNGGLVIQKWFAFVATTTMFLVTLSSFIWGCATNYAMRSTISISGERIQKLEARTEALEKLYHEEKLNSTERSARLEAKLDYLIKVSKDE